MLMKFAYLIDFLLKYSINKTERNYFLNAETKNIQGLFYKVIISQK